MNRLELVSRAIDVHPCGGRQTCPTGDMFDKGSHNAFSRPSCGKDIVTGVWAPHLGNQTVEVAVRRARDVEGATASAVDRLVEHDGDICT